MSVYDLTGRRALVTGGARGLGEGMARAMARAGAAVVIADIRADLGKATAESLRQTGAAARLPRHAARRPGQRGRRIRRGDRQRRVGGRDDRLSRHRRLLGDQVRGGPADPGRRHGVRQEAAGAVVGLTPLGRLGEVPDIADAVVFLASDGARFITGAGLPVDGGMGI
jgi:NAD(P)-dependent dehydrogenase (short-subunit alcohol dehydrogenase family)